MDFKKKGKKETGKESPCTACGPNMPRLPAGMNSKEAMKQMREMLKNKAKPKDCPYIKTCDFKMLPQVGRILCLDQEDGQRSQAFMAHLAGQHMWMQCRQYVERIRQEKGVLPRDVAKALKAKKK